MLVVGFRRRDFSNQLRREKGVWRMGSQDCRYLMVSDVRLDREGSKAVEL